MMTITVNGNPCELEGPSTVADLLRQLQLNPQQVAVEVNLELVPRQRHAEHQLSAGDRLEIVTLVGGG
jgi:thiamine biosynthesis protein ThiS